MASISSTVASPYANSYLSFAEADELMTQHDPEWDKLTPNEQNNIIAGGASDIDRLKYIGQPYYPNQKRQFPRYLDIHVDQSPLLEGSVVYRTHKSMHFTLTSGVNDEYDPLDNPWWSFVDTIFDIPEASLPVQKDDVWVREDGPVYLTGITVAFNLAGVPYTVTFTVGEQGFSELAGAYAATYLPDTNEIKFLSFVYGAYCRDFVFTGTSVDCEYATFGGAVFDPATTLPDIYKTGAVHAVYADGSRSYHDIVAHNIVSGAVQVLPPLERDTVLTFVLHKPVFPQVKEAQLLQMLARAGALEDYDPFVGGGIARIKIGDTERDYSAPRYGGLGIRELANRNRVVEQVFVLIGHLTVYGKFTLTWEKERAEVYEGVLSGRSQT